MSEWIYFIHPPRENFAATMTDEEKQVWSVHFERLQRLQKASIPAPRAVAYLAGLRVAERIGDAVILEALEPSVQLDLHLNDFDLRGEPVPDHLGLSEQVRTLVNNLAKAKLGHEDLHLGNFLLHQGKVYLLDGYAVRTGGLVQEDVFRLAHSASRFATRTDLLRGWKLLGPDAWRSMPNADHVHFYGFYIGNYPTLESDRILRLCDLLNGLARDSHSTNHG